MINIIIGLKTIIERMICSFVKKISHKTRRWIPFTNQQFVDNSNNPITDINELSFDSYIDFTEVGGEATECKACVQVKIIGNLNRPNTSVQIKNLVNALEREPGGGIGVLIKKG